MFWGHMTEKGYNTIRNNPKHRNIFIIISPRETKELGGEESAG